MDPEMVYLFFEPVFLDEFLRFYYKFGVFSYLHLSEHWILLRKHAGFVRVPFATAMAKSSFFGEKCQMADFSRHFLSFCNQFVIFLSPKVRSVGVSFCCLIACDKKFIWTKNFGLKSSRVIKFFSKFCSKIIAIGTTKRAATERLTFCTTCLLHSILLR